MLKIICFLEYTTLYEYLGESTLVWGLLARAVTQIIDAGVLTLLSKHDNLHSPLEISLCYQIQQTLGKTYFATRRKDRKLIIPCVFIDSACIFYHDILNSSEN